MITVPISNLYKCVPLGDIFTVIMGCRFAREIDDSGVSVIRGRDLAIPDPALSDIQKFVAPSNVPQKCFARARDILVQRIGNNPRCLLVPNGWDKCIIDHTILILRPKDESVDVQSVYHFLSSTTARRMFEQVSMGITVRCLTARTLSQIEIPVLPAVVSQTVARAQDTEIRIRRLADDLRHKREEIFDTSSDDGLKRGIAALQVSQAVVERGLSQVEDLTYRLRNFYPLPLAYPYRLIDAEHEPIRVVKQVYQNAEGLLAFLVSLMLALSEPTTGEDRKRLLRAWGGKGVTFNNWLAIADTIGKRLDGERSLIHSSLRELLGEKSSPTVFAKAIAWLVDKRDDFHHRDWPVGEETDQLIAKLKSKIATCFAEIEFLLQAELLLVLDFDADRTTDDLHVTCLLYAGDHPGCQRTERISRARLKKQDLYLVLDPDTWVSLYPYVSIHYCHHCRARETYYIDQWNKQGPAQLKSFERWHGEKSEDIGDALGAILQG